MPTRIDSVGVINECSLTSMGVCCVSFIIKEEFIKFSISFDPEFGIVHSVGIKNDIIPITDSDNELLHYLIYENDNKHILRFRYKCSMCLVEKEIFRMNHISSFKKIPLLTKCSTCDNISSMICTEDIKDGYTFGAIEDDFSNIIETLRS